MMAQGEYKKRSDKFPVQRKSKSSKKSKSLGPKKGGETEYQVHDHQPYVIHTAIGQYIAPKKAAKAKSEKLKKVNHNHKIPFTGAAIIASIIHMCMCSTTATD